MHASAADDHNSNQYSLRLRTPRTRPSYGKCQLSPSRGQATANGVSAGVLSLLFVAGLAPSISAAAAEIWVITDRQHRVEITPGARVIELDAPARIKSELAANVPSSDPAQTSLIVRQRLKQGGTQLQQRFAKAYQDVIDAWSLGVTKTPAVIVDRRYVIYGETNVARAVEHIETYRSTEK